MNKVDVLLKRDDNTGSEASERAFLENSKKFSFNKRSINAICKALCLESNLYRPEKTVKNIKKYIESAEKIDRVMYTEISNYIFSLDMNGRSSFASNVEMLLLYVLDENNSVTPDCRELTVRIYDHFQLALHQIENVNNIFAESIEEAKANLKKEVKGIEKEYISILGFMEEDMIYGLTKQSDIVESSTGEVMLPMYCVRIQSENGDVLKTYDKEGVYVSGSRIEENQITLSRVVWNEETQEYEETSEDQIMSTEQARVGVNTIGKVVTETYETISQRMKIG